MHGLTASTAALLAASIALASATPLDVETAHTIHALAARALPANAPHGYEPQKGDCPSTRPTIRDASSLSPQEQAWLPIRRNQTVEPMRQLFERLNISDFDAASYISRHQNDPRALPNIGIAVSGGGYRAMLNGAGVIEAFDSRTSNATAAGQLGGVLQAATYLAGLSGGNWLVGSLYSNNFTSIDSILAQDTSDEDSGGLWQLGNSIFTGPPAGIQFVGTAVYYGDLLSEVDDKRDAGFGVSITDYWGRALSFQLVNASKGGPAYTFSSVAEQSWFTDGSVPLPFLISDEREPGQVVASANSTIFTFSPWELGSDDPTVYGYAPLKYVGTNFTNGRTSSDQCVTGFDNVGFVMGTSSTLFNEAITTVNGSNPAGFFDKALQKAIEAVLESIGEDNNDIAPYPNPFYQYHSSSNPSASKKVLSLVDGGEDGQNIPLNPLIQPNRHVDVIFAVDSSADSNATFPTSHSAENWPAGISLVATYQRSLTAIQNGTSFPAIPDLNTFYNLGLQNRPTFFGCDAGNTTGPTPLIVYLPNAPYVYNSNVSTYDLEFNDTERNAIVLNGYNLATQGNGTLDAEWGVCVGCAILSRSLNRTGTAVPSDCQRCFTRYCWNGTVDSSTPQNYVPTMKLGGKVEEQVDNSGAMRLGSSVGVALAGAVLVSLWGAL